MHRNGGTGQSARLNNTLNLQGSSNTKTDWQSLKPKKATFAIYGQCQALALSTPDYNHLLSTTVSLRFV